MKYCSFCNKECKPLGLSSHERMCKYNPDRQKPAVVLHAEKYGSWRKGLNKETDIRIKNSFTAISRGLKSAYKKGSKVSVVHDDIFIKKLSNRQSLKNSGGKSRWYEISGVKVQGTWEYNIALKLNALNIKWEKPKVNSDLFLYKKDGKVKAYAPDFYLPEYNVYLEIKGYWWGDDKSKMDLIISQYPYTKFLIVEKQDYLDCLAICA